MSERNIGEYIRRIREARNITLKELCDDHISISQLSKFERGDSELSVSKLIIILNRMSVTTEELFDLDSKFLMTHLERMVNDVKKSYHENDTKKILKYIQSEEDKFKKTLNDHHRLNAIMLKGILLKLNDTIEIDEKDRAFLAEFLMMSDIWFRYELILFGNAMHLLNTQTLITLATDMVKGQDLYKNYKRTYQLSIQVLLRVLIVLIERDYPFDYAHFKCIENKILHDESLLYERNVLLFVRGIYTFKYINQTEGKQLMQKSLDVFNLLSASYLKGSFENYMNWVTNEGDE